MDKYELIIFDLDGTLADTSPGVLNSIRYAQKMMNLPPITLEQMYSHIGPPMEESYHRNFGLTGEALQRAMAYHKEHAINQGYKEIKLYDGIVELLTALKDSGYKTAVATLKAHTTALKIFDSVGLIDKFDVIKGVDIEAPMTKAQLLKYCMSALNIPPERSLLIGDSVYDAKGAKEAGISFLAVTYGFGFKKGEDMSDVHNVGVCDSVADIYKLLIE